MARALIRKVQAMDVDTGEYVYRQGGPLDFMYVVVSGSVRLERLDPQYGPFPVTVATHYDGQTFGDRMADVRPASAVAQEPSCVLRLRIADYRQAFEQDEPDMAAHASARACGRDSSRPSSAGLGDLHGLRHVALAAAAVTGASIRLRVEGLSRSPFFAGAGEARLAHLAANLQEIELREGDEFLRVGQRLSCCYLVLEGFVKVYVPCIDASTALEDPAGRGKDAEEISSCTADAASSSGSAAAGEAKRGDCCPILDML
eukprot:CAMPEP_0176333730 /NCGR_PEP_ID=MMETSP0121_2-20121125/77738_1 /TAXON_ID=160619 /ORGANISM="Kryptoperidinium foliaceum, Strain CCMP 1326" /LENGTH=258 /DNA_ID=CAMNT_0017676659 /DNA_START=42 /DNA_END=816 /DNA_ORIENTATION=-